MRSNTPFGVFLYSTPVLIEMQELFLVFLIFFTIYIHIVEYTAFLHKKKTNFLIILSFLGDKLLIQM